MSGGPVESPRSSLFELSREDLEAALAALGDAITLQSPDGTVLWANQAAADMLGYRTPQQVVTAPEEELAARFAIQDEQGGNFPPQDLPGRVALTGTPGRETLLRWAPEGSDQTRWSVVKSTPVLDAQGNLRFTVNSLRDVTARQVAIADRRKYEEQLAFMARASRALLEASLDTGEIAALLAESCVPTLGDYCAVWQPDDRGRIHKVAERSRAADPQAPTPRVTAELLAELMKGPPAPTAEQGPAGWQVAVPIPGRSGPLGALIVATRPSREPPAPEDLQLLGELARRAGVTMENALLYKERSRAAEVLSRSLMPADLPEVPGLELYAFVRPAASGVGGDFYDVVSLADGRSLLIIADVSGKGAEAAALTAMARYTLRALAAYHTGPAELLSAVNEALADQLPDGRFCTMACAAFGPSSRGLRTTVVVAGHPKPLILRSSGAVQECGVTGLPLGIFYRVKLQEQEANLDSGDALLLVTDGCVGEGGAGSQAIADALQGAPGLPARALAELLERVARDVQPGHPDDIAALVARLP